jgi:hypothetical protein
MGPFPFVAGSLQESGAAYGASCPTVKRQASRSSGNMSRVVSRAGATESYRVRLNVSALGLFGNAEAPPYTSFPRKRESTTSCKRTRVGVERRRRPCRSAGRRGCPMCAAFVDDEACVRDAFCRIPEKIGRVEAVAAPADDKGRCGGLPEPSSEFDDILGPYGRDHV